MILLFFLRHFEKHLIDVKLVFNRLAEANLCIKLNKCHFFADEVKYLGYVVSKNGIKTDSDKTLAITNYSTPTCNKDIESFLGMVGFYRQFVPQFSVIASPLFKLKGKKEFHWNKECEEAFTKLKICSYYCSYSSTT